MNAQTYSATVFFSDGWAKATGETPEEALRKLASLYKYSGITHVFTYRPFDGMIFRDGSHIPCGIVLANSNTGNELVCTYSPPGANVEAYCGKVATSRGRFGDRCDEHKEDG